VKVVLCVPNTPVLPEPEKEYKDRICRNYLQKMSLAWNLPKRSALAFRSMHSVPEPFPEDTVLPRFVGVKNLFNKERRRWSRASVHWEVQLFGRGQDPLECTTRNVSRGGFYILSERQFEIGERLDCVLSIPAYTSDKPEQSLRLDCRIQVVRVDNGIADKRFGTAYRILEYRVAGRQNVD
jgi:c-di-GMP-binding flagellar brake protein YcgR